MRTLDSADLTDAVREKVRSVLQGRPTPQTGEILVCLVYLFVYLYNVFLKFVCFFVEFSKPHETSYNKGTKGQKQKQT